MMGNNRQRNLHSIIRIAAALLSLMLVLFSLSACGETGGQTVIGGHGTIIPKTEDEEAGAAGEEDTAADKGALYIIEQLDTEQETITLLSVSAGTLLRYSYNLTTQFLDRYGNHTSWANFTCGQAVHIGELLPSSALSMVQLSDEVWNLEDVTKYTLDMGNLMLEVGGTKYHLTRDVAVFSNDQVSAIETIGSADTLRVVGREKQVLSIAVTTGHGYIELLNTSLFDGSLLMIGQKTVTTVYEGARIEVSEGTYQVTAANKGYGMTREYTVERNGTTVINMEELRGEGPKTCELTFEIGVEGATILLDGNVVNPEEVLTVSYGNHSLQVVAEGYETWKKTLVVNSAKATIELTLTSEDAARSGTAESGTASGSGDGSSDTESGGEGNTEAEGGAGSGSSEGSASAGTSSDSDSTDRSRISDAAQAEVDYLTTMSSLLNTLFTND